MASIQPPTTTKSAHKKTPTHIRILSQLQIGKLILSLPASTLRQFQKQSISSKDDIKALYLCRKNLAEMPLVQELTNLRVLWLNANGIREIGAQLSNMGNLQQIYLSMDNTNNQMSGLSGFELCHKLVKLNLAYNNIREIPTSTTLPCRLKHLLLSSNQITTIEPLSYLNLSSLQSLYLSGNLITRALTLRRLYCPNLKHLYLDNNKVTDFHRYDEIYLQNGGQAILVNLEYTLDEPVTTVMKLGRIFSSRARSKVGGIVFK